MQKRGTQKIITAGFVLSVLAGGVVSALAQSGVYTPSTGNPERKAIMNALRVPVEKQLKIRVIFVVSRPEPESYFRVKQGWAFVVAEFRHADGAPMGPGYYAPADGNITPDVSALLHRVHGRWHIVTDSIGGTDLPWVTWGRQYHTPPGLMPRG